MVGRIHIILLADKLYLYAGLPGVLESAFPHSKHMWILSSPTCQGISSRGLWGLARLNPDPNSQASNLTPVAQTSTAGYWMSRKLADYARSSVT